MSHGTAGDEDARRSAHEEDALGDEPVALTLVHTADWHLGRRFPSFAEEQQSTLTRARLEVLDRIFGEADKCGAHAVLCAGDLFDVPNPEPIWWEGLAERLVRTNPNRPIYLLPGNHDPLTPSSVWSPTHPLRARLPKHCQVVEKKNSEYTLGPNAVLCASPCQSAAGQEDLALALPAREVGDTRIRVGMVHGSTFDMPNYQANFPIATDAAAQRGLDYLAIGDTHAFRRIEGARVPTVYPSTPETATFGEKDTGYVALVFITSSRRTRVEQAKVAKWRWEDRTVTSLEELRALCRETDLATRVLRLAVEMKLPPREYEEAESLLEKLSGTEARQPLVGVLSLERQGLALDTRDIAQLFSQMPDAVRAAAGRLLAQHPDSPAAVERALFHLYELSRSA